MSRSLSLQDSHLLNTSDYRRPVHRQTVASTGVNMQERGFERLPYSGSSRTKTGSSSYLLLRPIDSRSAEIADSGALLFGTHTPRTSNIMTIQFSFCLNRSRAVFRILAL